jgi:membrane protein DedA with SNARE-associated domain/membrane-associated phospholipid phosphatase
MDLINYLLPKIEHFRFLGYWVVLLVSLLESLAFVGIVVPGSTFIVFIGALSARGYWDLADLIWFAAVGAILGDGISFSLGKKGKILFTEDNRIFKASYLAKGQEFFKIHGAKSVFLGRFIGPVRPVIPFIAGLSRMETRKFYFWNVLSAMLWASASLLLGYFFGHAWNLVEVWSSRAAAFLVALILFFVCTYFLEKFLLTKGKQLFEIIKSAFMTKFRAISAKPGVRLFVKKHPVFTGILQNRLNTEKFSGLPLTLMAIAFLYVLLALMGVIEDIIGQETIVAFDTRFENLLYVYRSPILVKIFLWITLLGKAKIVFSLAMVFTLLFLIWRKRDYILPFWITISGCYLFIIFGKIFLHRQRPAGVGVYEETFFSFPSGHATVAIGVYGFIAYFLIRWIGTWRSRLNLSFVAMMVIGAIGFSRLYLGVHFLSDVLGGYLLGLLWLIIGICMIELLPRGKSVAAMPSLPPPALRLSSVFLLLCGMGFYIYSGLHYHPEKLAPPEQRASGVVVTDILVGFADNRLSRFTESITGETRKPLNVIFLAENDEAIIRAMRKADWKVADPADFSSLGKSAMTLLQGKSYPSAPVTPAFWNGQANEMSFEKAVQAGTPGKRYEVRIWKTNLLTGKGMTSYVGLASLADGFKWWAIPKISPDIDGAREELFHDLCSGGEAITCSVDSFVNPVNRQDLDKNSFFTDGSIFVVRLP